MLANLAQWAAPPLVSADDSGCGLAGMEPQFNALRDGIPDLFHCRRIWEAIQATSQINPICTVASPTGLESARVPIGRSGAASEPAVSYGASAELRPDMVLTPQTRHRPGLVRVTVMLIERCRSVLTERCRKIAR